MKLQCLGIKLKLRSPRKVRDIDKFIKFTLEYCNKFSTILGKILEQNKLQISIISY